MFLTRWLQWIFWPKKQCQHHGLEANWTSVSYRHWNENTQAEWKLLRNYTVFLSVGFFALESLFAIVFHRKLKNGYVD